MVSLSISTILSILLGVGCFFVVYALYLTKPGPDFGPKISMVTSINQQYSPQYMDCSNDGNFLNFEDVDVAWDIVGVSFQSLLHKS